MKYYVKENQQNFYNVLQDNAAKSPEFICYDFFDYSTGEQQNIRVNRLQLLDKATKLSMLLRGKGVKKGDNVLIFSTQTVDNVFSVMASMLTGSVFTIIPPPVDPSKKMRFLSVVKSFEPKFLLCTSQIKEKLQPIVQSVSDMKIINVEEDNEECDFVPVDVSLDDVVYIQYSSGSTSAPKGVEITYGNVISNLNVGIESFDSKRTFAWVPFFHNMGLLYNILAPAFKVDLAVGIMSPSAFLEDPSRWLQGMSDFKAYSTFAPNSGYEACPRIAPSSNFKNLDFSNLYEAHSGAEIVRYSTMKNFANEYKNNGFNIEKFCTGYGLAETTCAIAYGFVTPDAILNVDFEQYQLGKMKEVSEEHENSIQFISGGKPFNRTLIKIVNPDTLKECNYDEFGEIWIQGCSVGKGYYKDEENTKATFQAQLEGYDGYFMRTGDLGILRNGHLFITGRAKELIIINGVNILPNDITCKLIEDISVMQHAVIVPFSINKDDKERLILLLEIPEKVLEKVDSNVLINSISRSIYDSFEVSPYEIGIVESGAMPRADNGKISILSAKKAYEDNKLKILLSTNENKVVEKEEKIKYITETEKSLFEIVNKELKIHAASEDNLLTKGMDSLLVVELAKIIENRFKVSVPVSVIFENPSIKVLAAYIDKFLSGGDVTSVTKDKSFLYDECKLDDDIVFEKYESDQPEMNNIFVTGTTGFVGAYLISDLLKYTNGKVYCHVRAKSERDGFDRIKENMKYYKRWNDKYKDRIIPVLGTLEKPKLGIDDKVYDELCEKIDTIYHNGAVLNFIYPYSTLKPTNVGGTIETLRIASKGKAKYYNYVSSYSVFDNPSHFHSKVLEDDSLESCIGYYLSYSETKWVSEKIIGIARSRGLRAIVYRPGEITGSQETGIWKYGDSVTRTIKSIMEYGMYAKIDFKTHMTQVDYITKAMVLIGSKGGNYGKAYNLLNKDIVTSERLYELMQACGYDSKMLNYDKWREFIFASDNKHPLKLLESLFKCNKDNDEDFKYRYGSVQGDLDTSNTENALRETNVECLPITVELMRKYTDNFK